MRIAYLIVDCQVTIFVIIVTFCGKKFCSYLTTKMTGLVSTYIYYRKKILILDKVGMTVATYIWHERKHK